MKKYLIMLLSAICLCMTPVYELESPVQKSAQMYRDAIVWKYKNINGRLYKRQYNYTTGKWIGDWIPV